MTFPYSKLKVPTTVIGIFLIVVFLLRYPDPKPVGDYTCIANSDCESKNCINGYCRNRTVFCGDYYCDAWETCASCSKDCGECRTENGKPCEIDGDCISTECVHLICRPTNPFEGDGFCDDGEDCQSTPIDCGYCRWI
ncbi:MAG: hypothetical protein GOU98_01215 [Candidatus Altiarchaeota archaeon]|nr:hypothetical protein [Candidatus Altiarchaeota archaeon]